jgi:hypothetical protein
MTGGLAADGSAAVLEESASGGNSGRFVAEVVLFRDAGMNALRPSTGALRAPAQDEAIFFVPSKVYLILRLRP